MGLEAVRRAIENYNTVEAVLHYIWTLKMEDRVQILYFWWEWWNERNRVHKKEGRLRPEEIAHKTRVATTHNGVLGNCWKEQNWRPEGETQMATT